MNQIALQKVHKSFGDFSAIQSLNLSIQEGDVYAFLGHNGAGKTTTLRLILGLLEADSGSISVFGNDPILQGNEIRQFCGVLSEDNGLYEPLTVYDNLIYYADIYGMTRNKANEKIDMLLELFDLKEKKKALVKGLSTGMKKKTALIRSMLHDPKLLLLDEPTNGLDPVSTVELREILLNLTHEKKTTIIMTTHNLEEVQKLCNKISIFRHGRDIFTGEMSSIEESEAYQVDGHFSLEKLYLELEGRSDT